MSVKLIRAALPTVFAAALLAGCSSVENSHRQKANMMANYDGGNNAAVISEIDYKLREPAWYNSSVVNTGDEVMWRLEAGSMNFHVGDFEESLNQFKIAEELINEYDRRADVSVRDVAAEAAGQRPLRPLPCRSCG